MKHNPLACAIVYSVNWGRWLLFIPAVYSMWFFVRFSDGEKYSGIAFIGLLCWIAVVGALGAVIVFYLSEFWDWANRNC